VVHFILALVLLLMLQTPVMVRLLLAGRQLLVAEQQLLVAEQQLLVAEQQLLMIVTIQQLPLLIVQQRLLLHQRGLVASRVKTPLRVVRVRSVVLKTLRRRHV